MSLEENGGLKRIPAIVVGWDAEAQVPRLDFDHQEFLNWGYVIAVLGMAVRYAEDQHRLGVMRAVQEAQAEKAQAEALRRALRRG